MSLNKSWKSFFAVIGLLMIMVSPTLTADGGVDIPTFVGGATIAGVSFISMFSDKKKGK